VQALSNRLMSSGACEVIDLADSDGEPLAFAESRALSMSNITAISFPLGLELGVAALRRRRARRLHYSMSSWQ
jgi:hypothetical protein